MTKNIKCIYFCFLVALFLCSSCALISNEPQNKIRQIKIGVSLYRQDDTFVSYIREAIEEYAKQQETTDNVKITVNVTDGKGNQSIQNDQVAVFISQGYDVICINEVDRTSASIIIDKAKTAGVPLVFFNREPVEEDIQRWDKIYYVGSKPKEAGVMQGQIVSEAYRSLPERLDRNSDGKLQYVMLEGEPGHQDATIRTEYSIKTVISSGIPVEKLANTTANWQRSEAVATMSQWIDTYGDTIEVVFSNNDDMALGAIDAYKAKDIADLPFIVGIDGTDAALDALEARTLSATVYNDAKGQGHAIFNIAYALATDADPKNIEKRMEDGRYVWLPHRIINGSWDEPNENE